MSFLKKLLKEKKQSPELQVLLKKEEVLSENFEIQDISQRGLSIDEFCKRSPLSVSYDEELFVLLWKYFLLTPTLNRDSFETLLRCLSGRPVLGTFQKVDAFRFFEVLTPTSTAELRNTYLLIEELSFSVPASIQNILFDFLRGSRK